MTDWTFEDALAAIQSPPSIPTSVLQSAEGLHFGDIHFVKIQTTLWMHVMSLVLLEKWIDCGSFNPEHKADGDYSHSTAILLTLIPDIQLKDIESMGIRLVVRWCRGQLAQISSLPNLITYVCSMLELDRLSYSPQCRMYCMIIGNYGGHLAFTTDPPFCAAHPLDFIDEKDPAAMTFRNQDNHLVGSHAAPQWPLRSL